MALLHKIGLALGNRGLAGFVKAVLGSAGSGLVIDDAVRIGGAELFAVLLIQPPWLVDERTLDVGEFWNPSADEGAAGILVDSLL
jgi:hypothetical protein